MDNKEIKDFLKQKMDRLKTKYNSDRILGLFVSGKANYGFAERVDDLILTMCYIPTFEELCASRPEEDKFEDIYITDIRLILRKIMLQESKVMECLFTDYYILNDKYKKVFDEYIYNNREHFFRINPYKRIEQAAAAAKKEIQLYQETNNIEYLFEPCRLRIACEKYIDGKTIEECIKPTADIEINYLQSVLCGEYIPDINILSNLFDVYLFNISNQNKYNEEYSKELRLAIAEIIKRSLETITDQSAFDAVLTKLEQQAYKNIKTILNNTDGNISIVELVEKTNISRPVYKNLLQKMKDYGVAEVINQGVKGTYIKFLI